MPGDAGGADKLRSVPPGQDVDMEGQGEILRIEERPTPGTRDLIIDPTTNLITDENFQSLPEPYRVGRYGYSPNKVALTFDDGPDPTWTPKILDVLKREQAPAAFFHDRTTGDKFSSIVERAYREGHEIGNHTFTHPDISNVSSTYVKVELNLTERLFASRLGIRTVLFRPPYSIDEEPDTADQVRPLEITQDQGFTTVGTKLTPATGAAIRTVRRNRSSLTCWDTCRHACQTISAAATSSCCMMAGATALKPCGHCRELLMVCGLADSR